MSNREHLTGHDSDIDTTTGQEQIVDALEEQVLGRRMNQVRHEDDDQTRPAFEQDLDGGTPEQGPGAEPS